MDVNPPAGETIGLSWLAVVTCGLVAGISIGFMLCAIAGCCRRRRPAQYRYRQYHHQPRRQWVAVRHPGGELGVACCECRECRGGCPA